MCGIDRSRQYSYVWDGQVKAVQLCVGWTGKGSTAVSVRQVKAVHLCVG